MTRRRRYFPAFHREPLAAVLVVFLLEGGLIGCGTPGIPRPPSLNLPEAATGVTANRIGDTITLTWTMPRLTTDKLPLNSLVDARICRSVEQGKCERVGALHLTPGQPAQFQERLSPPLNIGVPRLLAYTVELTNHAGQSEGPSNVAYTVAGEAPEPVRGLGAEVRSDGVLLHWEGIPKAESAGSRTAVRIHRKLLSSTTVAQETGSKTKPLFGQLSGTPGDEMLTVEESLSASGQGQTLDAQAAFDRNYTYTVERVLEWQYSGHTLTVYGAASEHVTVATRDVFPPAVPTGLVAVAVPEEHAIDLSWISGIEPDLAGYILYRRNSARGNMERLLPAVLAAPSFRDNTVLPSHKYEYAVSAVDSDGNESPRSTEALGEMPEH